MTVEDEMRPEYDFSGGTRGKHYKTYRKGTNLVPLDPDVAKITKTRKWGQTRLIF